MIVLIYTIKQFRPNPNVSVNLLIMEIFLNIFPLALKIEALLSKSGFEILSLFSLLNNMRFDVIAFIKPGNSTHCNWNQIINKTKYKDILL